MQNKSRNRSTDNWQKLLLGASITIYLLMSSGTVLVNLRNSTETSPIPEVRDYINKEVDRSYNRFYNQFNFALFLIGTSVWILRRSVVDQLRKDVGENLQKELEEKIHQDVMQQIEGRRSELLQRDYELEVISYEAVLRDDPKNYIAWVQQGRCFKKLSRFKEAVDSCDQAVKINPEYARAYYNKSCYHALQSDIESALQALNQAIVRESRYKAVAKRDPDFDLIQKNERFQALLN